MVLRPSIIPKLRTPLSKLPDLPQKYFVLWGGRGSGKSESSGEALIALSFREAKETILCAREYQNSIEESVQSLLQEVISRRGLDSLFSITNKEIINLQTGTRFIFKGLKKESVSAIKSMHGVKYVWIEEGQYISTKSLDILIPTIRKPGSKFIITMNREFEDDPVWTRFLKEPRDDVMGINVNWMDNPFFPDTLEQERVYDKEQRTHIYKHIWEGEPVTFSSARIFKGFDRLKAETEKQLAYSEGLEHCVSFDFGVQDDTVMIFYQVGEVPKTEDNPKGIFINIFDEYVNNNKRAEHYREILDSKGYVLDRYFCDPSGKNRDSDLSSWVDRIGANPKTGKIDIDFEYRSSMSRDEMISITNEHLPFVMINRHQTPHAWNALNKWSYKTDKDGNVTTPATPSHDVYSHAGTSLYYFFAFRFNPRSLSAQFRII